MLFILIGPGGSGKDTIKNRLLEDKSLNIQNLLSWTTRPIRPGEIPEKEYHFCNYKEFKKQTFIEKKSFQGSPTETWFYGTPKIDIDIKHDNYICIKDPQGAEKLKKYFSRKYEDYIRIVYLKVPPEITKERMTLRGDTEERITSRLQSDKKSFRNAEKIADIVEENINPEDIDKIVECISLYYTLYNQTNQLHKKIDEFKQFVDFGYIDQFCMDLVPKIKEDTKKWKQPLLLNYILYNYCTGYYYDKETLEEILETGHYKKEYENHRMKFDIFDDFVKATFDDMTPEQQEELYYQMFPKKEYER